MVVAHADIPLSAVGWPAAHATRSGRFDFPAKRLAQAT